MRNNFLSIVILIMLCALVSSLPLHRRRVRNDQVKDNYAQHTPTTEVFSSKHKDEGEIISVRITSSVAVDRGKAKPHHTRTDIREKDHDKEIILKTESTQGTTKNIDITIAPQNNDVTELPQELEGANIEFLKQLKAKKEARGVQNVEQIHAYEENVNKQMLADSEVEESVKSILEVPLNTDRLYTDDIPLARSVSYTAPKKNYIQGLNKQIINGRNNQRLTTAVNFQIIHNTPKSTLNYSYDHTDSYTDQNISYSTAEQLYSDPPKGYSELPKPKALNSEPLSDFSPSPKSFSEPSTVYSEPSKVYSEPPKIYSQPAKIYSEPAKFYSEPAKIYSEPARIYSEPAKIYSEPAKIYSEPAKFYSQPASLHLPSRVQGANWQETSESPAPVMTTTTLPTINETAKAIAEHHYDHQSEKNYEVDEKLSVMTDGKSHGVQETKPENCKQDNCKVGYVVEGRQYRKYRVEERTPDGFIVGEYGVVRNEDGALRGVRYTADSDASPRLIYDALMKFLQLK